MCRTPATSPTNYDVYGDTGTNIWQGTQASVGTKTSGSYGLNMFTNPAPCTASSARACWVTIRSCGGYYNLRGLPTWNLDANVIKDIGIYKERVGAQLFFRSPISLNHFQPSSPSLSLTSPTTFGQITGQATRRGTWSSVSESTSSITRSITSNSRRSRETGSVFFVREER